MYSVLIRGIDRVRASFPDLPLTCFDLDSTFSPVVESLLDAPLTIVEAVSRSIERVQTPGLDGVVSGVIPSPKVQGPKDDYLLNTKKGGDVRALTAKRDISCHQLRVIQHC